MIRRAVSACFSMAALLLNAATLAAAPSVEIFTRPDCGECLKAKAFLQSRHVEFRERDVVRDAAELREFYARGGKAVPWIFIDGQPLLGFDAQALGRALERAAATQSVAGTAR